MTLVVGTKLVARHSVSNAEVTGISGKSVTVKTRVGNVLTLPMSILSKYYRV